MVHDQKKKKKSFFASVSLATSPEFIGNCQSQLGKVPGHAWHRMNPKFCRNWVGGSLDWTWTHNILERKHYIIQYSGYIRIDCLHRHTHTWDRLWFTFSQHMQRWHIWFLWRDSLGAANLVRDRLQNGGLSFTKLNNIPQWLQTYLDPISPRIWHASTHTHPASQWLTQLEPFFFFNNSTQVISDKKCLSFN